MNTTSRIKNIFINLVLIISMVLSVVGGAFLMKPHSKKIDAAESNNTTLPDKLKFSAGKTKAAVSNYDSENGYVYTGSQLNYISAKNILYYANGGNLYTDKNFIYPAKDIEYNFNSGNDEFIVNKVGEETEKSTLSVERDLYVVEYNNTRYYIKNGVLYTDIECTNTNHALTYTIQYEVNIGALGFNKVKTRIEPTTLASYAGHYYVGEYGGFDYYVSNGDYQNVYYLDGGNVRQPQEITAGGDYIKPYKIYINSSNLNTSSDLYNTYITINNENYYIYNNEFYKGTPVFKDLVLSSKTASFNETAITVDIGGGNTRQAFEFSVNGTKYYAIKEDSENKVYDDAGNQITPTDFTVTSISSTVVTYSPADMDNDDIEKIGHTTNSVIIKYYFTEDFADFNNNAYAVNINGQKYYAFKNDSDKKIYQTNGMEYTNPGFTVSEINDTYLGIEFTNKTGITTTFSRYGTYPISTTTVSDDSKTYNRVYIEGDYYYVIKDDATNTLYNFDLESNTATAINTSELPFTITDITTDIVNVAQKYYYYINSTLCKKINNTPYTSNPALGSNIYSITTDVVEYELNTNSTNPIKIGSYNYFPIEILGETYFVKVGTSGSLGDYSHLYTLTYDPDTTTHNAAFAATDGFSGVTIIQKGHLLVIEAKDVIGNYTLINNLPVKITDVKVASNFVSYNKNYYYYDTKLYLTSTKQQEVRDFEYECDLSKVLINSTYYDVETANYQYIELFGNIYYVGTVDYETKLYTDLTIGGSNLFNYYNEVIDTNFAYKVDKERKVVSIFNTTSGESIYSKTADTPPQIAPEFITTTLASGDTKIVGYTQHNEKEYVVKATSNGSKLTYSLIYIKEIEGEPSKEIPFEKLNIDYSVDFGTSETFSNDTKVIINGEQFTAGAGLTIDSSSKYAYATTAGGSRYIFFYGDGQEPTKMYYSTSASLGSAPSHDETAVIYGTSNTSGSVHTFSGLSDYLVIANTTSDATNITFNGGSVMFSDSSTAYSATEKKFSYTRENGVVTEYTVDETNGILKNAVSDLTAAYENFNYSFANDKVIINSLFDVDKENFVSSSSEINVYEFKQIKANNNYYIVGRYFSSPDEVGLFINVDFDHLQGYDGNAVSDDSAVIDSTTVKIKWQTKTLTIESYISLNYTDHGLLTNKTFDNGSIVMLDNYLVKSAFLNNNAESLAEKEIELIYLGFGEKFTQTAGVVPESSYGLTTLQVRGFLKNDYVMKYYKTSSGYNESYGINININAPVYEPVNYTSQASENSNWYWYQHLNLTNLKANIDYNQEYNDGAILTEKIEETSGLYTFVFTYSYLDDNVSGTTNTFVFSFYLSESSDYVEYPTFNTLLTTSTSENIATYDEGSSKYIADGTYTEIVKNITSNQPNMAFSYNNQTFDKPVYVYDATKYNVSYNFKYNLKNHAYTTDFKVMNAGESGEFGLLNLYQDNALLTTYSLETKPFNDGFVVDYYLGDLSSIRVVDKINYLYGSLYVTYGGDYYLSLENYYYYNHNNRAVYDNEISYYTNGRLIKNGPQNTPETYVMVMIFSELGDYTFSNKYLISEGNSGNENIGRFKIVENGQDTTDTLQKLYTFNNIENIYKNPNGVMSNSVSLTSGAISRFASYTDDGEFRLPNLSDIHPESDESVTYGTINSNPTLKIFGINTTFNKSIGNTSQEIAFNKLDDNIHSDITPNSTFSGYYTNEHGTTTAATIVLSDSDDSTYDLLDNTGIDYTGIKLVFPSNYHVPLTNLQPVYFRYFGDFNYNNSYYYRYQKCDYEVDENGILQSVDFKNSTRTRVSFTNKTSISSSGFYVVVVEYYSVDGNRTAQHQYFMFAIDNSAPNLEIYTQNNTDGSDKQLFISSTQFSQTSRYTNKKYISASWNIPSYFQGNIRVKYQYQNYSGNMTYETVDSYQNGQMITTGNGKYIFTLYYGVNEISNTSTYLIVDNTTPSGELYTTFHNTVNDTYLLEYSTSSRVFNSPVTFVSATHKAESGARIYARIASISLGSYADYGKTIDNLNAITTNVEIDATNSLFNDSLDSSPIYNYFNKSEVEYEADVKKSQLLGLSDEPIIYIIKLYDEAGNSDIYYFIYDNSIPYILYRVTDGIEYVTSFENNTTQSNTEIVWNKYKAIHVKLDSETRVLFEQLKSVITSNAYNGMGFKEVDGETYLYVPINNVKLTSKVILNNNPIDVEATTKASRSFAGSATIFIDKTDISSAQNPISSANKEASFEMNPSLPKYEEFFRGNKDYQIQITDAIGNTLSKRIRLNSSFAQETFYGIRSSSSTEYTLESYNAYNIAKLTTEYKALEDQSFYARITYDYYNMNFENYLRESEDASVDEDLTAYPTFGYDLGNNIVYMFDPVSGEFVERGEYNSETKAYEYKYHDHTTGDGSENDHYYTYEELTELTDGKFYLPGYPFLLGNADVVVSTTQDTSGSEILNVSGTIYEENQSTRQGLYIFKRSYVDILTGREITQADIDDKTNESLQVLENDQAVRYYVIYVDRNSIIDLTYDASGIVDIVNSIGNLLQIYLGQDRDGNLDPVITAEILNSSSNLDITTNKLKVQTNFTVDKYATSEKLNALRKYGYDAKDANYTINEIGEDLAVQRNVGTFKYFITIKNKLNNRTIVDRNVIVNNAEVEAVSGSNNYKLWIGNQYSITIEDNAYIYNDEGLIPGSSNNKTFDFQITHSSPTGSFITTLDDGASIKELSLRDTVETGSNGETIKTFVSSNVENLSFTFSDSESEYDATIDPYSITVERVLYESQNAQGEQLFATNYSNVVGGQYYSSFGGSICPAGAKLTSVLQIFDRDGNPITSTSRTDNGAPYTYRINIFEKGNDYLLSNYNDDYVYIVKVKYVGKNESDYIINGNNYFTTTFKIHIDRVNPYENLNKLILSDPNLDSYCLSKYGNSYRLLSAENKQDLLENYAFPARYIENENIAHYYAKNYFGGSYDDISPEEQDIARYEILSEYSTIFNQNPDDSQRLYIRSVGNVVQDYKHSILPSDASYNDGGSNQDHPRFTQSASEYQLLNYTNGLFYFSDNIEERVLPNEFYFKNSYYEIIEEDEAGNLTRYLVYATDNTNVMVDFRYINSENDKVDNKPTDTYYFMYNDIKYYVINGEVCKKSNTGYDPVVEIDGCAMDANSINYEKYYHNNTIDLIPVSVTINGKIYYLSGSKQIAQYYDNSNPLEILNLASIHFVHSAPEEVDDTFSYLFDDFFTIKIYQGEEVALSFSSDPYSNNYSIHSFFGSVMEEFWTLVSNSQGKYEYSIEIINRFGYNNYKLSFNLPDQKLELIFNTSNPEELTVTLPSASSYVKILKFQVEMYEGKRWKVLTTDSKGNIIQTINADNEDLGLEPTTYVFGPGQYKFITFDNYGRGNGPNPETPGEYKIVGGNMNDTYEVSCSRDHIVMEDGKIVTSGAMSILINDSIYQLRITLKNSVCITKTDDESTIYYDLVSEGETTKLYGYVRDASGNPTTKYSQAYYHKNQIILGYTDGASPIYYYRGKLYTNTQYSSQIQALDGYTLRVIPQTITQYIYSPGNVEGDRTYYILNAICDNNISEYEVRINWTTDPTNFTYINLKIDRNLPRLVLVSDSGTLAAVENQNYNKPFTISWNSNYATHASLTRTINSVSTIINLNATDNYEINMIAGYTLKVWDEIGNELIFNFNYVENANEYFSVLVNDIEILPSAYVTTYGTSGKTIRYYYYDNTNNPTVVVKTDETKNIGKKQPLDPYDYDYEIIRTNINYTICYVKLVPVEKTTLISNFLEDIQFVKANGDIETQVTKDNSEFDFAPMKNQEYESFTLNVYKNLYGANNVEMIGNKVYVRHFYNDKLIRTYSSDSWSKLDTKNPANPKIDATTASFAINLSSTGVHRFEFYDSVGNTCQSIQITLIKDIMFTANNENPIDYRFYNDDVVIDVQETTYYNDVVVTAKLNGVEINTNEIKRGTKYTFSDAGTYEIHMTAQNSDLEVYESTYFFTIVNKNVTKMTFGFSNNYGFTISQVLKNQADITSLITSESKDSMWLTSADKDSVGTYTITLLGYDKLSNNYLPFTFVVKLNNEIPSIISTNYTFGTKSTKAINIQYNAAIIYSQVGESYISIIGDNGIEEKIDINADSLDELTTLTIAKNGKYRITIYNQDGIFIASYAVHKAAPLNTSAKIIIIVVVIVTIALTVTFIILRRHTKFR